MNDTREKELRSLLERAANKLEGKNSHGIYPATHGQYDNTRPERDELLVLEIRNALDRPVAYL